LFLWRLRQVLKDKKDCKLIKRYDWLTDDQIFNKYLEHSKKVFPARTQKEHVDFATDWFKKSPMRDKEHVKEVQKKHLEKHNKLFGVLSLTANPKNAKMWEEYSGVHTGFCIGFNTKKMFNHFGGGGEVVYYDALPDDSLTVEYIKQIFSKEKQWNFEEEYRTHKTWPKPVSDEDRKIKLPTDCYNQIIFGAKMEDQYKLEIKNACEAAKLSLSFYSAVFNQNIISIKKQCFNDPLRR
jgi:hypothetical protein